MWPGSTTTTTGAPAKRCRDGVACCCRSVKHREHPTGWFVHAIALCSTVPERFTPQSNVGDALLHPPPGKGPVMSTSTLTRDDVRSFLRDVNFYPTHGPEFDKAVDEILRRVEQDVTWQPGYGLLQNLPLDCDYGMQVEMEPEIPFDQVARITPSIDFLQGALTFFNGQDVTKHIVRFQSQTGYGEPSQVLFTLNNSIRFDFYKGLELEVVTREPIEADDLNLTTDLFVSRQAEANTHQWLLKLIVEEYRLSESHATLEVRCSVIAGDQRYDSPPINERLFWDYLVTRSSADKVNLDDIASAHTDLGIAQRDVEGLLRHLADRQLIGSVMKQIGEDQSRVVPTGYALYEKGYRYFGDG